MESKTAFTDRPVFPVLFIIIISVVFVGIIAFLFRVNEPGIERNRREAYEKAILSLCADSLASLSGDSAQNIMAKYPASFTGFIKALPAGTYARPAYEASYNGTVIAYVFDITGMGLWGTMKALAATDTSKEKMIGLRVYDQSETPGLGGRITEDWFTSQFNHKRVLKDGQPLGLELVPEGQKTIAPAQVRQITGATITSKAVINMLSKELSDIAASRKEQKQ
jgi:Na+-transporting NADH:ubiquinone oxidoreductase subunit C